VLNLNEQLNYQVIDGRVYVDFEQLLTLMYDVVVQGHLMATRMADPALGVMVMGQEATGKALEAVLTELKRRAGLVDQDATVKA